MANIGRRIVVYGPASSGKSTMAKHVAQSIDVPHIELDAIFWTPQWVNKPPGEFLADVSTILGKCTDGWVCDGNYSLIRDFILPLADTVIWLRPSYRVAFWWLLKRTITRCGKRELLWGTNRESWRQSFFSLDSLLLYQLSHWRSYDKGIGRDLKQIPHQASIIQLHSSEEINAFKASL